MCFQKYGDLYAISYIFFNLDIFTIPIFKTPMFQLRFKRNTSGEYITSHISLYQTILETIKLWVDISFKQPLVIIECDHFYKIVLLIMEKVVWFILVVWIVWSCLWCEYCCVVDIVVLLLLLCYCCCVWFLVRIIPQWC